MGGGRKLFRLLLVAHVLLRVHPPDGVLLLLVPPLVRLHLAQAQPRLRATLVVTLAAAALLLCAAALSADPPPWWPLQTPAQRFFGVAASRVLLGNSLRWRLSLVRQPKMMNR